MSLFGKRHSRLSGNDIGTIVWKEVADAAARLAIIVSEDKEGRVVKQLDDGSFWVLDDYTGPTWTELTAIGVAAVTSVAGQTGDVVLTETDITDLGSYPDSTGQVTTKVPTTDGAGGWTFEDPGTGGTTDHGALGGLGDDDHTQYLNNARGDARYSVLAHTHATLPDADQKAALDAADSGGAGPSAGNPFVTLAEVGALGGGTVTSVAVSGTDGIEVDSGSPVTTAGTITLGSAKLLGIEAGAVAAGAAGDAYATSHEADATAHDATDIVYDPTGTGIDAGAVDVDAALADLDSRLGTGATLEEAINGTVQDNDVIVPAGAPIVFRDNDVALTPLSITKTETDTNGSAAPAMVVKQEYQTGTGIRFWNANNNAATDISATRIQFDASTTAFYIITPRDAVADDGTNLRIYAGSAQGPSNVGGTLHLNAGDADALGDRGNVEIGTGETEVVKIGGVNTGHVEIGETNAETFVLGDLDVAQNITVTGTVDGVDIAATAPTADQKAGLDAATAGPNPPTAGNRIATQADVAAGGGGDVSAANSPLDGEIARWTSSNTIEGLTESEFKAAVNLEIGTDVAAEGHSHAEYPDSTGQAGTQVAQTDGAGGWTFIATPTGGGAGLGDPLAKYTAANGVTIPTGGQIGIEYTGGTSYQFITDIHIHDTDSDGMLIEAAWIALDVDDVIIIRTATDRGIGAVLKITSKAVVGTRVDFGVSVVGGSGTIPEAGVFLWSITEHNTGGGGGTGDVVSSEAGGTVDGEIAVFDDTTGKLIRKATVTEADVVANNAKVSYTDAAAVGLNTTHRTGDGSDHTDVAANTTAISDHLGDTVGAHAASAISNDSGVSGADVAAALDTLDGAIGTLPGLATGSIWLGSGGVATAVPIDTDILSLSLPNTTVITTFGKTLVGTADASAARTALGGVKIILQGVIGSRPAAGTSGRYYHATDEGLIYYDTGSVWELVGVGDHAIGSDSHLSSTLAEFNLKVSDQDILGTATPGQIAGLVTATAAAGDWVMINDTDDANNPKKVSVSDLTGGGGGGQTDTVQSGGAVGGIENTGDNVDAVLQLIDQAQATVLGRASGAGTGKPTALTATQQRTILNVEDNADVTDAANVAAAGGLVTTEAAQISALSLVTAVGTDHLLIEDASDSNNKKRIQVSDLLGGGTDGDAVHLSSGSEISTLATVSPASGDFVLIEDVSDSNNKKKVLASNFLGGGALPESYYVAGSPGNTNATDTPVVATGATTTPAAGTYIVNWGMDISSNQSATAALAGPYKNATGTGGGSVVTMHTTATGRINVSGNTRVVCNGSDVIDLRFARFFGTSTVTAAAFNMTLIQVTP